MDSINTERSYTEYTVTEPTTEFAIGFEDYMDEDKDTILVTHNGILVESLGYAVLRKNKQTVTITPAITEGTVRLTRETDIDEPFHKFTAGALFSAKSVDQNFEQIRHSQQEVRDGFVFLEDNTNGVVSAAEAATDRANAAAALAENTDLGQLQIQLAAQKLDTGITVTAKFPDSIQRTQAEVNATRISAADFGAVGDGVTDDTAAIHKARDYALSIGGAVIEFPSGTFLVSKQEGNTYSATCLELNVGAERIAYVGAGRDNTIIKQADGQNAHVLNLEGASKVTLANMTIDGNRDNQGVEGYCIRGGGDILSSVFKNLRIINSQDYGIGLQHGTLQDIIFDSIDIYNTGRDGVDLKNRNNINSGLMFNNITVAKFGMNTNSTAPQAGLDIRGIATLNNIFISDYGVNIGADGVRFQGSAVLPSTNGKGGIFCRATNVICKPSRSVITGTLAGQPTKGCVIYGEGSQFSNCLVDGAGLNYYSIAKNSSFNSCLSRNAGTVGFLTNEPESSVQITACQSFDDQIGLRLRTGSHVVSDTIVKGSKTTGLLAEYDSTDITVFNSIISNAPTLYTKGGSGFKSLGNIGIPNFGVSIAKHVSSYAATDGNLYSGVYRPVAVIGTNTAEVSTYNALYTRVGDVVQVSAKVDVKAAAVGSSIFTLSLPVPSTFTNEAQAVGIGRGVNADNSDTMSVVAKSGTNTVECKLLASTTTTRAFLVTVTYQIL